MNKPIRRVAIVVIIMFGLMLGNQTYTIVMRQDSLNNHPTNRRTRDAEFAQDRGQIMVGQSEVAQTVPSEDQYKFLRPYPDGRL